MTSSTLFTDATSGKVKRIRRNPHVLVAPCTATGRLLADPVPAQAELLGDPEVDRVEGRKIFASGELFHGETLCADAEGVFISVDFEAMRALRERS